MNAEAIDYDELKAIPIGEWPWELRQIVQELTMLKLEQVDLSSVQEMCATDDPEADDDEAARAHAVEPLAKACQLPQEHKAKRSVYVDALAVEEAIRGIISNFLQSAC